MPGYPSNRGRKCDQCGTKLPFGRRRNHVGEQMLCDGCAPDKPGSPGRPIGLHGAKMASTKTTEQLQVGDVVRRFSSSEPQEIASLLPSGRNGVRIEFVDGTGADVGRGAEWIIEKTADLIQAEQQFAEGVMQTYHDLEHCGSCGAEIGDAGLIRRMGRLVCADGCKTAGENWEVYTSPADAEEWDPVWGGTDGDEAYAQAAYYEGTGVDVQVRKDNDVDQSFSATGAKAKHAEVQRDIRVRADALMVGDLFISEVYGWKIVASVEASEYDVVVICTDGITVNYNPEDEVKVTYRNPPLIAARRRMATEEYRVVISLVEPVGTQEQVVWQGSDQAEAIHQGQQAWSGMDEYGHVTVYQGNVALWLDGWLPPREGEHGPTYTGSMRTVAHDSGDGETIYHCPFCGAGQVTARSDGTAECGFCETVFTVQVQPKHPSMPQTVNGVPVNDPSMPGDPTQQPLVPAPDPVAEPGPDGFSPAGAGGPEGFLPAGTASRKTAAEVGDFSKAVLRAREMLETQKFIRRAGSFVGYTIVLTPDNRYEVYADDQAPESLPWYFASVVRVATVDVGGRVEILSYRTEAGAVLNEESYLRHLAIVAADDKDAVIEQVRASRTAEVEAEMTPTKAYRAGWNASKSTKTYNMEPGEVRFDAQWGRDLGLHWVRGWVDYASDYEFDPENTRRASRRAS